MINILRLLVLYILLPVVAQSAVIFEDSFDNQADWTKPRAGSTQSTNSVLGGTDFPTGWDGYYLVRTYLASPSADNGIILDNRDPYGGTGKAVFFMMETDGEWDQRADANITKLLTTGQAELYINFKIKFDADYAWGGTLHSPIQKLMHITRFTGDGTKFYQFFTSGAHFPSAVPGIQRPNNGAADPQGYFIVRPDPSYTGKQPGGDEGPTWYFDIPSDGIPLGNYGGTGTDWTTPGMLGDGSWHTIEYHVSADSAPGADDGVFKMWLDGNLQHSVTNIRYREIGSTAPDNFFNYVSIGGNCYNPWSASDDEQGYAVDEFVISTTYVGTSYIIGDLTPVNGSVGSANGGAFSTLNSSSPNLCATGTVYGFTGTGPWTWGCQGLNGGTSTAIDAGSASLQVASNRHSVIHTGGVARVRAGTTRIYTQ